MSNKTFWNEICGTQAFKMLGLERLNMESLDIFYSWYMNDMYPYLYKYLDLMNLSNKKVLEIGLGFGTVGQKLFLKSERYIGLDYASKPVELMNYRIKMRGQRKKAYATHGDARNLPFKDNEFDMVVSIGCLHHTGNIQKSISEVYRVLNKNGKAIIMLYNKHSWTLLNQNRIAYALTMNKRNYNEYIRGLYDKNSKGNSAPTTTFSSRIDIEKYFSQFKKVTLNLENFNDVYIPFLRAAIPRKYFLNNAAKIFGLDYYIVAQK